MDLRETVRRVRGSTARGADVRGAKRHTASCRRTPKRFFFRLREIRVYAAANDPVNGKKLTWKREKQIARVTALSGHEGNGAKAKILPQARARTGHLPDGRESSLHGDMLVVGGCDGGSLYGSPLLFLLLLLFLKLLFI